MDQLMPSNVDEAITRLKQELSKEDIEYIRSMKEEGEVISLHMTLGNYIRNAFGLWGGNFSLRNSCIELLENPHGGNIEPDDCSHEILKALWNDLQT